MKRIASCLAALIIILAFSVPAFADNDTIIETTEYTSLDENETTTFQETLIKDDKEYELVDVEYKVLNTEQETTEKTITQSETYLGLSQQEVPQFIKSNDYPDISLELTDVQYTIQDLDSTMTVTGTTDYGYLSSSPAAAQSKDVEYTSNIGNTLNASLSLVSVTQTEAPVWRSGYNIYANYYGEIDSEYYQFNDVRIPNTTDGSVPYQGYENTILNYLGIDNSIYRIDSASWTGSRIIDGVTVRTAEFTCSSLTARYTANYTAEVPNQGYSAEAVYISESAEVPTGNAIYTIQAAATYELVEQSFNILIPISIAIVVVILVVLAILFLLKHSKKQEE